LLVLDASVAVQACLVEDGFGAIPDRDLRGPPLLWSETRSALHSAAWRGELAEEEARAALERLEPAPLQPALLSGIGPEAWAIADRLGWAKTYDAEYVATAALLGCRLVTADRRLLRATRELGMVIGLDEL
jgi:predicted nucleic acid-binding protein